MNRESAIGAVGGVVAGYLLWLTVVSIGQATTTADVWSIGCLLLALLLVGIAAVWRRRPRRLPALTAFVIALPALPVLLSVIVLAELYLA